MRLLDTNSQTMRWRMERAIASQHWISGILGLVACMMFTGCSSLSKGDVALDMGIKDRGVASW